VYSSPARNFNNPALVGYSQSHDEERTMYKICSLATHQVVTIQKI
jgi:hypothetical protein